MFIAFVVDVLPFVLFSSQQKNIRLFPFLVFVGNNSKGKIIWCVCVCIVYTWSFGILRKWRLKVCYVCVLIIASHKIWVEHSKKIVIFSPFLESDFAYCWIFIMGLDLLCYNLPLWHLMNRCCFMNYFFLSGSFVSVMWVFHHTLNWRPLHIFLLLCWWFR